MALGNRQFRDPIMWNFDYLVLHGPISKSADELNMKLNSKYFDSIRTKPKGTKKGSVKKDAEQSECQWDGCEKKGEHKAPVGRNAEGKYFKFCADHVRQYNKGYNYFEGLSDGEVARYQKEALTGHRPTWGMGVNKKVKHTPLKDPGPSGSAGSRARMNDTFGFFEQSERQAPEPRMRKLKALETKAFDTLGLPAAASSDDIKARYKELVKKHHPDANGGDRGSEERFREVIQAYQMLKSAGFC
jgi:curved DNA-binding protein CbpA